MAAARTPTKKTPRRKVAKAKPAKKTTTRVAKKTATRAAPKKSGARVVKKTATRAAPKKRVAARPVKKASTKPAAPKKRTLSAQAKLANAAAEEGLKVNHIAFVVDRSYSMSSIRAKVVKVFNNQLARVKENAKRSGQMTFVSYYTFSTRVDKPHFFARPAAKVQPLKSLAVTGMTALIDATGQTIVDLSKVKGAKDRNVSFLVIVLTDGYENASRKYKAKIGKMIQDVQKTGRWSLAFLCPKNGVKYLKRFKIPAGNIQVWDATAKGTVKMEQSLRRGVDNYYAARSAGQRAVTKIFTTDLSRVSVRQVSTKLTNVSRQFVRWKVERDAPIKAFVDGKLAGKGSYEKGRGYYELTKPETVQAAKQIAIVDGKTGAIYAGDAARTMLGLPIGEKCKVKPGDHGGFAIFVESTSLNRKLIGGTTLLYRVG